MITEIKLLDENAVVPTRAHDTDTGYDLTFIGVHKIVEDVIFFKTGIAVSPPRGFYFDIVPCSRISKQGFSLANSVGIIDESYRGEILVALRIHHTMAGSAIRRSANYVEGLINFEGTRYRNLQTLANDIVRRKPVLTQMILRKREDTDFVVVEELNATERGDGGFGSTEQTITLASARKEMLSDTNSEE